MALIMCKDCEKEISSDTTVCPNCGARTMRSWMIGVWIFVAFMIFVLLNFVRYLNH